MIWLLQNLRLLWAALCAKDSPRQMAAGLACGLLLGLVPKGNLLAVLVGTTLLATRMSLATGMLMALCVSLVAPWCDPATHALGYWVLTLPPLTALWGFLTRLPLANWTYFNNTVVMGSFVLGTLLMYPTYRLSLPWMVSLQQRRKQAPHPGTKIEPTATEPWTRPLSLPSDTGPPALSTVAPAPTIIARRIHPAHQPPDPPRRDERLSEPRLSEPHLSEPRPPVRDLDDPRRSCA